MPIGINGDLDRGVTQLVLHIDEGRPEDAELDLLSDGGG
jgi:hypothetical protein